MISTAKYPKSVILTVKYLAIFCSKNDRFPFINNMPKQLDTNGKCKYSPDFIYLCQNNFLFSNTNYYVFSPLLLEQEFNKKLKCCGWVLFEEQCVCFLQYFKRYKKENLFKCLHYIPELFLKKKIKILKGNLKNLTLFYTRYSNS